MSATKLVIRRPVLAHKPRRFIGQEVFRTIVQMAYEMELAQTVMDAWENSVTVLSDMLEHIETLHTSWMKKKPSYPNTILTRAPRVPTVSDAKYFIFSQAYRHPTRRRGYTMRRFCFMVVKHRTRDGGNRLREYGEIQLHHEVFKKHTWQRPEMSYTQDDYSDDDTFIASVRGLRECYEREAYYW
jgi:hypothetical protein